MSYAHILAPVHMYINETINSTYLTHLTYFLVKL